MYNKIYINQFKFQVKKFLEAFKELEEKYTEYPYPNNLKQDYITSFLGEWATALSFINTKTKKYLKYFDVILII